ncbi:uncharacterized protein LOC123315514 isoform X2 [Coccinella septempunctata]|uniref:uncharacterized protein LOC123315514 isoform X2 n=1 Tax=Coccinella septempunctata TaxID=41139 RepID=UPI001D0666D4|nr:uncharacterized protein LOC123315514 isoform X2 [Coccinella septempunctata]
MSQSVRAASSKAKRSTKERDKRKSHTVNQDSHNLNIIERTLPIKDTHSKRYAGLSIESIKVAAEHITFPDLLSEESCEILAEDLNYKLRYIIHQAANRAFISNRSGINRTDIEETFQDLQIEKIYGAPSDPLWIPLADQNCLFLDDPKVNLIEVAEEELAYSQPFRPVVHKKWLPESKEPNNSLKNYFNVICEAVVSNDIEVRKMALQNISVNPNIGPIINWLYKFGYVLLSKDVTYNSLTFYALDLIETLEMSPLGNTEADENQLKLLVRLILQRLLKSYTNPDVLKPMCWVLAILCRRYPLKEYVLAKLKQKLPELSFQYNLSFLMIVNALGIEAIIEIFLKNFDIFFIRFSIEEDKKMNGYDATSPNYKELSFDWQLYGYPIMEMYYILVKNNIYESKFNKFPELANFSVLLSKPQQSEPEENRMIDFINMKKQLIKTRRKIEIQNNRRFLPYESVFEVPIYRTRMKQKMENHYKTNYHIGWKKQSHVVIGKTSLLLPVMKNNNSFISRCYDHSLSSYNL